MVEAWVDSDSGFTKGCVSFLQWGDAWPAIFPIYIVLVFGSVGIAGYLAMCGHRAVGTALVAVALYLAFNIIGSPQCYAASSSWEMGWWSNWIFIAFVVGCAVFLRTQRDKALRPGGWASALVYKKVAPPSTSPFFQRDLGVLGPLNELLTMTYGEILVWGAVCAWLAVAFIERYTSLTDEVSENTGYETYFGNKTRAAGKGFAQMAVRCLFLAILTPSRNVTLYQLFGIPFDRGIKQHKQIGRLFYVFMVTHVLLMLAGGTEKGPVKWSNAFNLNAPNLWPGPLALAAFLGQFFLSLPYWRRNHFEMFYWLHLNFMFMGNMFLIFHNRFRAVIWIVPTFAFFWLDMGVRWYTKLAKKSSLVSCEVVDKDLVKLVVNREGFPSKAFDFHPGSYIWLSVDVPEAKRAELMRKPLGPPMAPAEIPSFLWFHPITVSSYDETTRDLTLFIKRMGAKDDEWSGQIIKTVQAVKSGALEQSDVRVYVGGPHGNLQVQPANVDHVVLCAGGIGVTPMAAILEDQIRNAGATQNQTTLIWTTRAPSEMKAFAYLFDAIAALPAEQKKRFDVRVFVTSGKENTADVEASASKIVKVRSGRPDFDALVSECARKTDGHVGVYVCGPDAMSDAAENAAVANKCLVHRETFEF